MLKFYFSFLLFILSDLTFSQNTKCICEDIDISYFDELLNKNLNKKAYSYLKLNSKNSKNSCKALSYQLLSEYFTIGDQYNLDSVKFYLDKEKTLLPKVKCDLKLEMEYYSNLSTYYLISNNLKLGNENLLKSLEIAEKLKDFDQLYLLYSNLSILFSHLNQQDRMLFYTNKVRKISYLSKDKTQIIKRLSFVADSYNNYYKVNPKSNYKDSVYVISKEILRLSKKIKYDFGLFRSYELMHNKPYYDGDYNQSLKYLDSAAKYIVNSKSFNSIQSKATIYRKKHDIFLMLKEYKNALTCTDSILKFAIESNQDYTLMAAYKRKYETYKAMGRQSEALFFYEKFSSIQDSVYGKEKLKIVNELEAKYNKVQNEKQILKLQQEKKLLDQEKTIDALKINLLVIAMILTFLAIFVVIILFRQKNLKQIQAKNNLELKLNRSRINPHFFFNALSAFQTILIKEDNKKNLLLNFGTFSKFMRQILESSYDDFITIDKEIKTLENYMKLQLIRDENKFNYQFILSDEIDPNNFLIPAMMLQPLVENAIEHGFKSYKEKGLLELKFEKKGNHLEIKVCDNGIFSMEKKNNSEHKSRAGQIMKERFEMLSKLHKKTFSSNIHISEKGTEVCLKIPVIYKIKNQY